VIVIVILLLLIIVGGVGAYFWWQYNQPEASFYRVLENNLKINYVERKYTATYLGSAYDAKLQADAKTDFTKPESPKSSVSLHSDTTASGGETVTHETNYIMPGADTYMAMLHEKPQGSLSSKVATDQWYQMRFNSAGLDSIDYYLDQSPKQRMFNSPQGMLPIGNFTADQRSGLMNYIKAHNVYTMTKSETEQNITTYTVTLNTDALNGLNNEIATTLGVKPIYIASKYLSGASKLTIVVDNKSEQVKQTSYTVPDGDTYQFQGVVDYTYPANVPITVPSDAKSLSGGINL
jgi:hypothetical protein